MGVTRFYNATLVTGAGVVRNAAFVVANGRFAEITGASGADDWGRSGQEGGNAFACRDDGSDRKGRTDDSGRDDRTSEEQENRGSREQDDCGSREQDDRGSREQDDRGSREQDDCASWESLAGCDLGGRIVVPGFIDTHIHGVKGCDFEDPDCDFAAGARVLKMTGTTSFFATISPFTPSGARKPPYRTLACEGLEGFHLEGPYLNPAKQGGFYDGQIRLYDEAEADEIIRSFRGVIRIVTAAPECVDLSSLVALSRRHGFALSAGHTNADYDTAIEAFGGGFSRATHLFNAMRAFDHREPGVLDAALLDDRVHCELIADLRHISPQALKLALRLKPIGLLTAITDSVCPDAPGITVRGSVAYKGDTVYGSQSTMYELFRHLTGPLDLSLADAVRMTSVNAGQAFDLDVGDIVPGMRANFLVMDSDYRIEAVYTASDFGAN